MSKTQVKKELEQLSHEQLVEFIAELYSSCRAARPYLDFYCNPDINALFDRYATSISKETQRGKRRYSTARISRIRADIREFATYGIETPMIIDLMLYAVRCIVLMEQQRIMKKPILSGCVTLINETLELADKSGIFTYALERVEALLDGNVGSRHYIAYLLKNIKIDK